MTDTRKSVGRSILDFAPWLTMILAAVVSLPALGMPFLSDDWAQIDAVGEFPIARTPFGDFRPVFMTTLWLDRLIGGLSPWFFHLTNMAWIAATAALVVVLIRRYTCDRRLALATGLIFAGHPFHVENAAWIAARSDPVFSLPYVLALLTYDRWRLKISGPPLMALVFFEISLLAKESATTLPLLLLLIGLADSSRRPSRREWYTGLVPLGGLAIVHFFLIRPLSLGGAGRTLTENLGFGSVKNGLGLAAAAIIPVDVEILVSQPVVYGTLALSVTASLLVLGRLRSGRIPPEAYVAGAAFAILISPYVVGFQERYLFLPIAASSLFLATLIQAARGRAAVLLLSALTAGWIFGSLTQWTAWFDAAVASRHLVDDLVSIGHDPRIEEIVIANAPFRVHGSSVAGDFRAALQLSGGRPIPVRAACWVSYPTPVADFLSGPPSVSIQYPPPYAEVRLQVREGPFSHLVWPRPAVGEVLAGVDQTTTLTSDDVLQIRLFPDAAGVRAAFAWVAGHLQPLYEPRMIGASEPPSSKPPR